MKKCIKKGFRVVSFAVGYTFILGALYATAISYMVSARKAEPDDKPKTKWKDNVTGMYH